MLELDEVDTIDVYMRTVYVITSHLIIFNICRLLINTCKVYWLLLFRANFLTMDLFRIGVGEKISNSAEKCETSRSN